MKTVLEPNSQECRRRGNPALGVSLPYSEVREFIKPFKFKNIKQYQDWVRAEKQAGRGQGFPLQPHSTYLRRGEWINRKHFLGLTDDITIEVSPQPKEHHNDPRPQKSVGWKIIRQIFGLGKDKQFA
jgi:hypothetical protein